MAGRQPCRKEPRGPGRHQFEHKPTRCPCGKEGR